MSAFFERVRAALAPKGYEVLRELGSGGMGIVVLARDVRLDGFVAVKVLRPGLWTVEGYVAGQVHRSHAAASQFAQRLVALRRQSGAHPLEEGGHESPRRTSRPPPRKSNGPGGYRGRFTAARSSRVTVP